MKSVALFAMLAISSSALAGDLNPPPGPVAPSMKTLDDVEPRTAINDENTPGDATFTHVISEAGSYYLTGDLEVATDGGILVSSSDVTIDLNGFRIFDPTTSAPNAGINAETSDRLTVRNGVIIGFTFGVLAGNTAVVEDLRVDMAQTDGISVGGTSRVSNCTVVSCVQSGIEVGGFSVVSDCVALGNGIGINTSQDCVVKGCVARFCFTTGIAVGTNSVVRDCTASSALGRGFSNSNGQAAFIACVARANSSEGFFTGDGSRFADCIADSNGGDGFAGGREISLDGCTATRNDRGIVVSFDSNVIACVAVENQGIGIGVANGARVESCVASLNVNGDGISAGIDCAVINNNVDSNGSDGISVSGACTIRGNSATGNEEFGIRAGFDCAIEDNTVDDSSTGIGLTSGDNRVDGNHVTDCVTGYLASVGGSLFVRNTSAGNLTAFDVDSSINELATVRTDINLAGPWDNVDY